MYLKNNLIRKSIKYKKLNLNKFNNRKKHYVIISLKFTLCSFDNCSIISCIYIGLYTIFYSEAYYGFKSRGHTKSSLSPEPDNRIFKACGCGEYLVELINVINRLLGDDGGLRVNSAAMLRNEHMTFLQDCINDTLIIIIIIIIESKAGKPHLLLAHY